MSRNWIFILCLGMVVILFSGCKSTAAVTTGAITDAAVSGGIEIGRIRTVNQQLTEYSKQSRDELARLTSGTGELRDIISSVFDIAFGLCDEIDRLTSELRTITEDSQSMAISTDNMDTP